jgi:DNA topoisomerase-3
LRDWRLEEARRRRIPAFRILTNQTLAAIASTRPTSSEELLGVRGVGPALNDKYGQTLLALVQRAQR